MLKKITILILWLILYSESTLGQCAMCRATLENNVSNGNVGIAAGINFGILYLFAAPYIVISLIAYFWYKSSRRTSAHEFNDTVAR
jgi:hypothetical protein